MPSHSNDSLPTSLYTAAQVRELDRLAIEEQGIPGEILMERAGRAAFDLLRSAWPGARRIVVMCGTGNNGGDGFVVGRLALEHGVAVRFLQLGDPARIKGDALLHRQRAEAAGGEWQTFKGEIGGADLIVDALLGTGLEREVSGHWAEAVAAINGHPAPVLALDIPSGLHSDSGEVLGCAVRAAATISFIGLKRGLFTGQGPACSGVVHFDDLQVPQPVYQQVKAACHRVDWRELRGQWQPRSRSAHKGHFGHVLVVGGDHGFGGAARLAAEGALRVGAGLVSLATREAHVGAVLAARPEIMVHGVPDAEALRPLLQQASVVVVGPGLGRDEWGRALWQMVLEAQRPLVVDADALNLLAASPLRREDWILTPHPGEAGRLLAVCNAEINADRFAAIEQLQRRYGGVIVLKGAGTLMMAEGRLSLCSDGNPGMASGGMGDVLSGVIGGLLAQCNDLQEAVLRGVCLHAAAADRAAAGGGERGMLASDLLPHIRGLNN